MGEGGLGETVKGGGAELRGMGVGIKLSQRGGVELGGGRRGEGWVEAELGGGGVGVGETVKGGGAEMGEGGGAGLVQ